MVKESEKWKAWQTRRNKLSIVYFILAIFFIIMTLLIMFGVFNPDNLQFWSS